MHTQYWQQTVNLAHFSEMLKTPSVDIYKNYKCGPMPNVMATLPNIGGALCSTPQECHAVMLPRRKTR